MRDVDIREILALIPNRHIVIGFAGSIPAGLGLMGLFAPPAEGSLAWLGDYAGPLLALAVIMNLPLWFSCARASLVIRRRMDYGPD